MTAPTPETLSGTAVCARNVCTVPATCTVTGRCLACHLPKLTPVCDTHERELTEFLILGVLLSACCEAPCTLVGVVPL